MARTAKKGGKRGLALTRPTKNASPALAAVIGRTKVSWTQIPKLVWAYIRRRDKGKAPKDKVHPGGKKVFPGNDGKLAAVLGRWPMEFTQMPGKIKRHVS